MLESGIIQKQRVKLPKILSKPKSITTQKMKSSGLESVTAKAWLYCSPSLQLGHKSTTKREIASLTKIMTMICTMELCEKYRMHLSTTYFKITDWAAKTNGTTANLVSQAWMTIDDLLYGLMLPSGNDAAITLAQNIGAVIYFDKAGNHQLIQEIRSIDLSEDKQSVKFYVHEFITFMNQKCTKLKMYKTRFSNPHGLDVLNNYSCCDDVLLMCKEAMKCQKVRKIVCTINHQGMFKFFKDGKVICKPVTWNNTHKLLGKQGVYGIKTGITNKAGGCLSTVYQSDSSEECYVIVLGCQSTEDRFRDTSILMNWAQEEKVKL